VEHQRPDTTYRRTENMSIHNTDIMLISEMRFTEKKATQNFQNIQSIIQTIQQDLL
jgi:hypothetical protein